MLYLVNPLSLPEKEFQGRIQNHALEQEMYCLNSLIIIGFNLEIETLNIPKLRQQFYWMDMDGHGVWPKDQNLILQRFIFLGQ